MIFASIAATPRTGPWAYFADGPLLYNVRDTKSLIKNDFQEMMGTSLTLCNLLLKSLPKFDAYCEGRLQPVFSLAY